MKNNEIFPIENNINNNDNDNINNNPKSRYSKLEDLRITSKPKTQLKKVQKSDRDITKHELFDFFKKPSIMRTNSEIIIFGKFLSDNYQYFKKIKNEDTQLKVEQITKICRLEKFSKNDSIINYGEIGDKFYIVLEGIVEVYKPKYIEIEVFPNEFISIINRIKDKEGNSLKYERVKEKNKIFFDMYEENDEKNGGEIINAQPQKKKINMNILKYKQIFLMETEEKLGEYGEGFSFGDVALIKKSSRNATIKAKNNCVFLTIENNDYNKAIVEFQKMKLIKEVEDFIKTYSFFKDFSQDKIIRLFNCFSKKTIYKNECLFEQNKKDEYIYFINEGTFSISCNISFSWLNDYLNYIDYNEKNILSYLIKSQIYKYSELLKITNNCYSKLTDNNFPLNKKKDDLWEQIHEKKISDNLYRIKKDEEKLNEPDNVFNIEIKKINYNEILGTEEVFDFKKRFCTCRCISEKADIKYITVYDLLKLIIKLGEDEIKYLLKMINERKKLIKEQIIKAVKNKERNIIFNFNKRYEDLLKNAEDKKVSKIKKNNLIFSALKMKGIKYNLQDIIDNNIDFLDPSEKRKNSKENKRHLIKNKSNEILLKEFYIKRKAKNKVKLKIIKNAFSQREIKEIRNSQPNSFIFSHKNISRKNVRNPTRNSKYFNFSESSTNKFFKRKSNNYSMDKFEKIIKPSIENTPSRNNFEYSKTIEHTPDIQNIKETTKILNKDSPEFQINEYSDKKNINLPKLLSTKTILRNKSNIKLTLSKGIKGYNDKIYNFDKSILSDNEFKNKIMNKALEKKD